MTPNSPDLSNKFLVSGEPGSVFGYECFEDLASDRFVDGQEYIRNQHDWSHETRLRWQFLYRISSQAPDFARPQKELLRYLRQDSEQLATDGFITEIAIFSFLISTIFLILKDEARSVLIMIPFLLALLVSLFRYTRIITYRENIEQNINAIEKELDSLYHEYERIIAGALKPNEVDEILKNDIIYLKNKYLEINQGSRNTDSSATSPSTAHAICSWAALQYNEQTDLSGYEGMVLNAELENRIGKSMFSWRSSASGLPVFRLWYLTIFIFNEHHFDTIAFCYDFVTQKEYNIRSARYAYDALTVQSYRTTLTLLKYESILFRLEIPRKLINHIYDSETEVCSMMGRSGIGLSIHLLDNYLLEHLRHWLSQDRQISPIESKELDLSANVIKEFNHPARTINALLRQKAVA